MSATATLAAAWSLAALVVALVTVRLAIAYAHRRGLFDQPGQRRSHTLPTPRGGGIGIVLACLVAVPGALWTLPGRPGGEIPASLAVSLCMVAAIGWWDDHRPLRQWPRLAVQLCACLLFGAALLAHPAGWAWLPLLVLAGAWSINLHNFMDGIDALLALQGLFAGIGLAVLARVAGQPALAGAGLAVAAACLGFWWYNRSPARIFMGDVGSGSVGLLLFALSALLWRARPDLLWALLALHSSFLVDAGMTLLNRIVLGRRWYAAHREHLYQWLVRSGATHVRVAGGYLAWNLGLAGPVALFAGLRPHMGMPVCVGLYLLACAAWVAGKRRCRQCAQGKGRRHVTS